MIAHPYDERAKGGALIVSAIPSPRADSVLDGSNNSPSAWPALGAVGLGYMLVSWGLGPITAILPTVAADASLRATQTIVRTTGAEPALGAAAGGDLAAAGWVMNAYFLLLVASVLIAGRLGDLLGHRRLFRVGVAIYGVGALASAVAPELTALVAARALQGVGAAMVYGTSLALVAEALPGVRRGLAVGVVTMSASVASFLGVAFSAYAVEQLSWRWAFWVQVPLALLALAATTHLPARPSSERVVQVLRRLDWRGAMLLFGALTIATLSLDHVHEGGQSFGAGAHYHLPMHALALVLLLAFVRVEAIVANPLLRLRMLRDGRFAASIFANGVAHMSMLSAGFVIPFLLERGHGLGPSATRDTLVVMQAATVVCSVGAGWLYDRRPSPALQWLTFGGIAGGLLVFGLVGGSLPYVPFMVTATVLGASQGAFSTVNNAAVLAAADAAERGSAAGLLETTRHLGHSLGVSLSSGMLESLVAGAAVANLAVAYQTGFEQASLAMAALAGLAVAAIFWSERRPARATL